MKLITRERALFALIGCTALAARAEVPPMPNWGAPDTLAHYQVGPGTYYTHIHFPSKPLHLYITKVDMNNPYNRMEQYQSNNRVPDRSRETTLSQTRSNSYEGHKVFAAVNHDFYDFTSNHNCIGMNARNGEIMHGGGWGRSAIVIDNLKRAYVISPKQESQVIFADDTKMKIDFFNAGYTGPGSEQCFLFNKYNSLTLTKEGFYVKIRPQGEFLINGEPVGCEVLEISDSPLQTSDSDYVLFFQSTKAMQAKELVKVGDIIHIDQRLVESKFGTPGPNILQALHGYPSIVKDGHFHEGEYNDFEGGREKEVAPHTMAGISKDGKTIYLLALDGRSSRSVGSSCLEIAGYLVADGAYDVVNFDSGGSTTMVVNDKTMNVPSDGSERIVMDSFHAISIAPSDDNISEISFNQTILRTIAGAKTLIPILGFNQYGDLIDKAIQGVDLTNSLPEAGLIDGSSYVALSGNQDDKIKASFNGIARELTVRVEMPDSFAIETRSVIVGKDPHPLSIVGFYNKKSFELDGQAIEWSLEDPSICSIDNGIITGLKNGRTRLTATLEGMVDEIEVRVEILEGVHTVEEFKDHQSFTISGTSNIKNLTLTESGLPQEWGCGANMSFDFTKGRASNLSLTKSIEFQGQPDTLLVTLNTGGVSTKSLLIHLSNQKESRAWSYNVDLPQGDELTTLRIPLLNSSGEKLGFDEYPLSFEKLYFMLNDAGMDSGNHSILWRDMKAKYGESDQEVSIPSSSTIQGVVLLSNPVYDELSIKFDLYKESPVSIYVYSLSGNLCKAAHLGALPMGTYHERLVVSDLPNGTYLLLLKGSDGTKCMKFIKK